MNVIRSHIKPRSADNTSTAHLTDIYSKTGTLNENNLQHFGSVSKFLFGGSTMLNLMA